MTNHENPIFECPKCGRHMQLVNFRNEEHTVAMVECVICAIREIKDVPQEAE